MARGFLVANVGDHVFSVGARLGDPSPSEVKRLAERHGYEIKTDGHRRSFKEREEWPLTLRAYTSFRKDGRGRSGSSLWSYPARALLCKRCNGEGYRKYTRATCGYCRGTGKKNPDA